MKHLIVLFSCLLLLCLSSSCEKAGQIHLISAHTWVVKDVSNVSTFAKVGDELTFMDNRLFFNISNGVETDGRWDFTLREGGAYSAEHLFVSAGFGAYDFTVTKLTNTELELQEISGFGSFVVRLEPKE